MQQPSARATPPSPGTTGLLLLRPGRPVLRRDRETLQVGLGPTGAVRLPDHPAIRALLAALRSGRPPGARPAEGHAAVSAALAALRAADLVIEVPGDATTVDHRPAQAHFGADAARRATRRGTQRIGLRADLPSEKLVAELLADADLVRDDEDPTVWLIVAAGQVPRASVDPWQRAGVPHLVVSGDRGTRRVGPFVDPGVTACLRCVDAHEAVADPRLPLLLEQAAHSEVDAEPVDPVLERLALSWAVRDLARYAEGDEPSTWSATVDIGPVAAPLLSRRLRHPHCGCAWDTLLDTR